MLYLTGRTSQSNASAQMADRPGIRCQRAAIMAGASLAALMLSTPAHAACVEEDDATVCTGDGETIDVTTSGDVTIENGGVISTSEDATSAIRVNSGGAVSVLSNVAEVTGEGTAEDTAAIDVLAEGDVNIVSNEAHNSRDAAYGISAQSTSGNVTVDSGSITVDGDQLPYFVINPDFTFTFNNSGAIGAIALNGDVAVRVDDITALGELARGVTARGRNVDIVVDGSIQVTQSGVLAISSSGSANVLINGNIESSNIGVSTQGQAVVEIAQGGNIIGGQLGIAMSDLQVDILAQIFNSGTVEAVSGPAVGGTGFSEQTEFYIRNNGELIGGEGLAVLTEGRNDTLELTELSQITGLVDLGAGNDRLVLDFNDDALAGVVGQVASTVNVEYLAVDSGNWLAAGSQSVYETVEIEEGAALTIAENADGDIAVAAPYFELDGQLNLDLVTDTEAGNLSGLLIEGAGSLHLIGEASVLVDDASGLQYTGGTFVEGGTLLLTDEFGGDIATLGDGVFELAEGGDFTGDLVNDGTFIFSQEGDYDFLGDFSGQGLLEKHGDGTLTFEGFYAFGGTTSVFGGSVAFTGQLADDTELDLNEGTLDLSQVSGGQQTVGQLSGQSGALLLGNTDLTVNQSGNTVFGGSITGSGSLIKDGQGDLKLEGDGTGFTGTGQVGGGTLSVNGNFSNANFVVNEGGVLGGAGTVGNTNVNGGTAAPGNSIDTLTVNGDVSFTAASVYEVEVNAAGQSDLVAATGTATLGGATVQVLAEAGTYRPITDYTILTADDGVSGEFGAVSTNFAFLDSLLSYSDTAVTLRLVRNDIDFSAFGSTPNEVAIATLIEGLGFGNTLYDETLMLADDNASPSFATLTGEVYPDYGSALIETAEMLRRQTASGMTGSGSGAFGWATGLYNSVDGDRTGLGGFGAAGGFGFAANGLSAAIGLGMLGDGELEGDVSESELTFVTGQVAYGGVPNLSLSAGVQLGWFDGSADRITVLGALTNQLSGEMDGDYLQLSGEIAYNALAGAGLAVEPFIGLSHVSLDLDALTETGGATAISVGAQDRDVTFGDVGVRLAADAGSVQPFASVAYRHAWGDREALANVSFAGNAGSALISGLPISKDAAELSAGLAFNAGMADFTIGYEGTLSDSFDSHGVSLGLKIGF